MKTYKIAVPERECKNCKKLFRGTNGKQVFCSQSCNNSAYKKRNGFDFGGKTFNFDVTYKYDGNWKKAVLRDGACKLCGSTKDVEIHHVDNRGDKCDILPNHELGNLMTVCHKCHNSLDDVKWYVKDGHIHLKCKGFELAGLPNELIVGLNVYNAEVAHV